MEPTVAYGAIRGCLTMEYFHLPTILTDGLIRARRHARAAAAQEELTDATVPGLKLRLGPRQADWSLMIKSQNGERRIHLGHWPELTAKEAQEAARLRRLDSSIHGGAESVQELIDLYESRRAPMLRRGKGTVSALRDILSDQLSRDVTSLTKRELATAIANKAMVAPAQANRQLAYLKAFFNWSIGQGLIDLSPAAGIPKPARERPRERTPSLAELACIWRACETRAGCYPYIVRLLMLTGCRAGEVAGMRKGDLDLPPGESEGVWTIPSSATKGRRSVRIPLSPAARQLVEQAVAKSPHEDLIFSRDGSSPFSGWSRAKASLDRARSVLEPSPPAPWRLHDLRRSFATIVCDELDTPLQVVDRCLNHVGAGTTSAVSRVYARSELFSQRRRVLNDWADLILRELGKPSPITSDASHELRSQKSTDDLSYDPDYNTD